MLKYRPHHIKLFASSLIQALSKSGKLPDSKSAVSYNFSLQDSLAYAFERIRIMPPLEIVERKEGDPNEGGTDFIRVRVGETELFWPKMISTKDLPWLYSEIYAPFGVNPSSYWSNSSLKAAKKWVIDAGACEGFFTRAAIQKGCPKVITVEPVPILCQALGHTFQREISEQTVFIEPLGLAQERKTLEFKLEDSISNTCISSDNTDRSDQTLTEKNVTLAKIETAPLDEILPKYNLCPGGLIKMDIEGAEMIALMGAQETLKKLRPSLAIAVYHSYENAELCKKIILNSNPTYKVHFRGQYAWDSPSRPYMLFAH
jgi:FkbM family methyltransferase